MSCSLFNKRLSCIFLKYNNTMFLFSDIRNSMSYKTACTISINKLTCNLKSFPVDSQNIVSVRDFVGVFQCVAVPISCFTTCKTGDSQPTAMADFRTPALSSSNTYIHNIQWKWSPWSQQSYFQLTLSKSLRSSSSWSHSFIIPWASSTFPSHPNSSA